MFEKDHEERIKQLVTKYESAKQNGEYAFFEEQDLDDIFQYYYGQLDYEKAMEVADSGIEQYKYSGVFYNHKAEILKEISHYEEALKILEQAEIFSPNELYILLNKVDIYSIQENFKEAIRLLEDAIETHSGKDKAELFLELADVFEDAEEYKKVIWSLKECLKIDNSNEEALNRIWFSIELTEDYENSILFHKEIIDKNPYNYLAWTNLGHAYKGLLLFEKSVEAFEFAMAIEETYESAYIECADVLYKDSQFQKAINLYTEVLDITSHKKEIFYNIGKCFDALENYGKAREFYKESLSIDPSYARAYFKIGKGYLNQNLAKNALQQLEKAYKLDNKNIDYQLSLAEAYLNTENHDKALEIYEVILKNNDSNKQVHLNLITILYEIGDVQEALNHIEEIEEKFEDISDLLYIKVAFLYELNEKDQAIIALFAALEYNAKMKQLLLDLLPTIAEDKEIMHIFDDFKSI